MATPDWRQSARKRAEVAAIATLGYPVVRALTSTWTWKVSGAEHVDAITAAGHQPILALWHGRILAATPTFSGAALSRWPARTSMASGSRGCSASLVTARLADRRHAAAPAALRQLVKDVKAHGVAFTLDGPRGPAEVAQPGAVWLAKATGNRCCRFIPKPPRAGR